MATVHLPRRGRLSNADGLYIKFSGRGGHGAVPQATIDPVMMAARFIVDVQSVISREKDPTEFGVVTIGAIHGGTAGNIIPDEAMVLAAPSARFKPEVRAKMLAGIERTAKAVAAMADAPAPEIRISEGTKAVINDPGVVATAEKVLKAAFGDKLRLIPPRHAQRGFFGVRRRRRALDVLQYRRLRAGARGRRPARAEDRRCRATIRRCSRRCRSRPSQTGVDGHDARRAQRVRPARARKRAGKISVSGA